MLEKITVRENQTIFDIVLQIYGTMEGLVFFLEDNPNIELDVPLIYGQELLYRQNDVLQTKITNKLNYPAHG